MAIIRSFRDFDVYVLARDQAKKIFTVSKGFPNEEKCSLTDQIRRSSRAVNTMIAEAWARRKSPLRLSIRSTTLWAKPWKRRLGWTMHWIASTWTAPCIAHLMMRGSVWVQCSTG